MIWRRPGEEMDELLLADCPELRLYRLPARRGWRLLTRPAALRLGARHSAGH